MGPRIRRPGGLRNGDSAAPLRKDRGHNYDQVRGMPWGQRVAHVQDLDGNTVNLAGPLWPSPSTALSEVRDIVMPSLVFSYVL